MTSPEQATNVSSFAPGVKPAQTQPSPAWQRFTQLIENDAGTLSALLAAPTDLGGFSRTVTEMATRLGIALGEDEVRAATMRARHDWLQRHIGSASGASLSLSTNIPGSNWLPIHLHTPAQGPAWLDWAEFGTTRLTDPFFEQSTGVALRHPARLLFRRKNALDVLDDMAPGDAPELEPSGFVFHLSRCGSTLLAQLLATCPRHRVLSEAQVIDQLLAHDLAAGLPHARRVARLRALVSLMARRRFSEERRLFIKWDAWHTLHLAVIRDAFPNTPWVYLHRDPVEVLVSQRRQRGFQFIPGMMAPEPFGIARAEIAAGMDFDAYAARVLGASAAAAVRELGQSDGLGRALDYAKLREGWPRLFAGHFRIAGEETDWTAMQNTAARSAKNPRMEFADDREAKHREADATLRSLAETWLGESRRALMSLA